MKDKTQQITLEDGKKMLGTEFLYIFEDGDSISVYLKAFDPKVGLSCYSLSESTKRGWSPDKVEEDGTFCVIGVDIRYHSTDIMLEVLQQISTGRYLERPTSGYFAGCVF